MLYGYCFNESDPEYKLINTNSSDLYERSLSKPKLSKYSCYKGLCATEHGIFIF
jgi:hypothetical protein